MENRFDVGAVIRHRRYHYRGVIATIDPKCRADDDWYLSNQTQPDRDQPWYHVLVDGSDTTTYVAEENLELDGSGEPVEHPLIKRFFTTFHLGKYYRQSLN